MKRQTLIFMVFTLLCLTQMGCHDFSYQGLHDVVVEEEDTNPQKVIMFIGTSTNIQYLEPNGTGKDDSTKGTGVIGSVEGFTDKSFNIYAFLSRTQTSTYELSAKEDSLFCLIDGSLDDPESIMGREAMWNPESNLIDWKGNAKPVFYPTGEALGLTYDFFAYYVDDMELKNEDFHRTQDSVEIDIEIDGSQDIMSAVAVAAEDELWFGTEDSREYAYRKECTYSYYTAQLGIHPRFIFKHHLTKLDFRVLPGVTGNMKKDIRVDKVEVYSKHKANFVVAHRNHNHVGNNMGVFFKGEKANLVLKEEDGSEFQGRMLSTVPDAVSAVPIDDFASLLVAPDTEYYIYLTLSEWRDGRQVSSSERNEVYVYLGNGTDDEMPSFEAGNEYMITMTVHGKMDVDVSVEMVEWEQGGDFNFDFDEEK